MEPRNHVDVDLLRTLWADRTVRSCEIAERLGISSVRMYQCAQALQLPPRNLPPGGIRDVVLPDLVDDGEAEPHEESEGEESLRLDPWVAKRAAVVREQMMARMRERVS